MSHKQAIIKAIKAVAKKLRHAPSRADFLSHSGIPFRRVLQWFDSWNDAVKAAGLRPYLLNQKIADRVLLEDFGRTVRKNPLSLTRRIYLLEGKHNPATLAQRFGGWRSVPQAFRDFAKDKREWADVLECLPVRVKSRRAANAGRHRTTNATFLVLPCKRSHACLKGRPTYGNPSALPCFRHEPVNEQGVVLLFGMLARELGYVVENVQGVFPDCEAKRQIGPDRWQTVHIEFEFESKNFHEHGHSPDGCDVIVCWRHNWPACPKQMEVLELSSVIKCSSNFGEAPAGR